VRTSTHLAVGVTHAPAQGRVRPRDGGPSHHRWRFPPSGEAVGSSGGGARSSARPRGRRRSAVLDRAEDATGRRTGDRAELADAMRWIEVAGLDREPW